MTTAEELILRIVADAGEPLNSTRLVKLVYLIDYLNFRHYGETATGFGYIWDHFGPNAVDHAIIGTASNLVKADRLEMTCYPNEHGSNTIEYTPGVETGESMPSPAITMIINDVMQRYGGLSTNEISEVAKQTEPFRNAAQKYDRLPMEQSAPMGRTTDREWEAHLRELEASGTKTLDEVRAGLGKA